MSYVRGGIARLARRAPLSLIGYAVVGVAIAGCGADGPGAPDANAAVPVVANAPPVVGTYRKVVAQYEGHADMTTKRISFGRKNGAADTHDNSADFCAMEASPGHPQKDCK